MANIFRNVKGSDTTGDASSSIVGEQKNNEISGDNKNIK